MRNHTAVDHEVAERLSWERMLTSLQAAVSQTVGGVILRGNLARPVYSSQTGSNNNYKITVIGGNTPGRLVSVELRETSANPILVRLYTGTQNADPDKLLATIPLTASQNVQRSYPSISFTDGLLCVLTAPDGVSPPVGQIEGVIVIGAAAEA